MSALETASCSVARVYWPEPVEFIGVYGTATVEIGEPLAVLADGSKIPL